MVCVAELSGPALRRLHAGCDRRRAASVVPGARVTVLSAHRRACRAASDERAGEPREQHAKHVCTSMRRACPRALSQVNAAAPVQGATIGGRRRCGAALHRTIVDVRQAGARSCVAYRRCGPLSAARCRGVRAAGVARFAGGRRTGRGFGHAPSRARSSSAAGSVRCARNEMARRNRNGILIDFSSFVAREAFPLTRSTDAEPACAGRADRREPPREAEFAEGVSPGRCRAARRFSRFFLVSGSVP